MKNKPQSFFFLLCSLLFTFYSLPTFCQKQFTVFHYTSQNGLPQNSVKSCIMDNDGFLWMTTEAGLVRFDGRNFRIFNRASYPFLRTDRLSEIHKTINGDLFFFDGLQGCYQILLNTIKPFSSDSVAFKIRYTQGSFPNSNLFEKFPKKSIDIFSNDGVPKSPITVLPITAKLYAVGTKSKLAFYNDTIKTSFLNLSSFSVSSYFMIEQTIYFVDEQFRFYKVNQADHKITRCVFDNKYMNSGSELIWNNGRPGVYVMESNKLFALNILQNDTVVKAELLYDNLPQNCHVKNVFFDKLKHILFIGTDTKGLYVCKENIFKTFLYNHQQTNTNNAYYAQVAIDSNTIITSNSRKCTSNGFAEELVPFNFNPQGVICDHQKNIWFNSESGIYKYNLITKKRIRIKGSTDYYAYCFLEIGDTMWVGAISGWCYVLNDSLHVAKPLTVDNNKSTPVCMISDKRSNLIVATANGAYRFNCKTFQTDSILGLQGVNVRALIYSHGYLFAGTYGNGFYMLKNNKISGIPLDRNNYLQQVHSIFFDSHNFVWLTTNQGLFKTRFADLQNYFDGKSKKIYYQYYAEDDGISTSEFNGGCSPPYVYLENGFASLPSMDGLVWFKPNEINDVEYPQPVLVDAIYLNDELTNGDLAKAIEVSAGTRTIKVNLACSFWGNSKNLLIEYKLLDYSQSWTILDPQRDYIEYANLPAGNYTLLIRKKIGLEPEHFVVTHISFSVMKKWYRQTWFLIVAAVLITLIISLVARIYAWKIRKSNKSLEEKINLRTIELLHANEQLTQSVNVKDKLISIVSHDIVTPLRFIAMVAGKGSLKSAKLDSENLRILLTEIKSTSEKLRDNAQNILNWIKYQNKRIEVNKTHVAISALVDDIADYLKEMADAKSTIILNMINDDDIFKTDKNMLSIILHNLVTNAIKFTSNGSVTISGFHIDDKYEIIIADTGLGMDAEQLLRIKSILSGNKIMSSMPSAPGYGNGLGFIIISELITLLQGQISIDSKPKQGTTIKIIIEK